TNPARRVPQVRRLNLGLAVAFSSVGQAILPVRPSHSPFFPAPFDRTRKFSDTHKTNTRRRVPHVRRSNLGLAVAFSSVGQAILPVRSSHSPFFPAPFDRTRKFSDTHKTNPPRRVPQVRRLNLGLAVAFSSVGQAILPVRPSHSPIFQAPFDRTRKFSDTHKTNPPRRVPQVRRLNLGLAV